MPDVIETVEIDAWSQEVADKAKVEDADYVRQILTEHSIPGARVVPAPRKLRVDGMHFSGVKNLQGAPGQDRQLEPFSFTHTFSGRVDAFATNSKNDAGKSTIVNVILWGLRGISNLQKDVRAWTRRAAVAFSVNDEKLIVLWNATVGGGVSGHVLRLPSAKATWAHIAAAHFTSEFDYGDAADEVEPTDAIDTIVATLLASGATIVARFLDSPTFVSTMNDMMMSRLGFDIVETWQKNAGATEDDDGGTVPNQWGLWSQALAITDSSVTVTLGEVNVRANLLLQTYLGAAWGPALTAAATQSKVLTGKRATQRRLSEKESTLQNEGLNLLLEEEQLRIAELKLIPDTTAAGGLDSLYANLLTATDDAAEAQMLWHEAAAEYGRLERELELAQADLLALEEAAKTSRFWHSLKPTCCPRCDTKVDEPRWAREQDGSCSLCDSPLKPEAEPPAIEADPVADPASTDIDEDPDDVSLAVERVDVLERMVELASAEYDRADGIRTTRRASRAQHSRQLGTLGDDSARRRLLEQELATLRGRIQERQETGLVDRGDAALVSQIAILDAAAKVAKKHLGDEQNEMLAETSEHILRLAQSFGFENLERVKFDAAARLRVRKGGEDTWFSYLNDGERLRLKIAIAVALLHVGSQRGVGRHPGLLIVDSLLREEVNPDNARILLLALQNVSEQFDLQIIVTSASGELFEDVLMPGTVRHSGSNDFMW